MPNYTEARKTGSSAWVPLIGFIVLIVLAGFAFLAAPAAAQWLSSANWSLGAMRVLPMNFPGTWSEFQIRLAVAAGIFLTLFALGTIIMLAIMGTPMGETDVTLKEIRDEKKQQTGGKRRRR